MVIWVYVEIERFVMRVLDHLELSNYILKFIKQSLSSYNIDREI
jgi:hypothetical protein